MSELEFKEILSSWKHVQQIPLEDQTEENLRLGDTTKIVLEIHDSLIILRDIRSYPSSRFISFQINSLS